MGLCRNFLSFESFNKVPWCTCGPGFVIVVVTVSREGGGLPMGWFWFISRWRLLSMREIVWFWDVLFNLWVYDMYEVVNYLLKYSRNLFALLVISIFSAFIFDAFAIFIYFYFYFFNVCLCTSLTKYNLHHFIVVEVLYWQWTFSTIIAYWINPFHRLYYLYFIYLNVIINIFTSHWIWSVKIDVALLMALY